MASDESMTIRSCISMHEGHHYDDDTDDGYDHQPHPHSLSRLSICTKSSIYDEEEEEEEEEEDDGPDMDDHYANYYYQGQDQDHQDQGEQQSTAGMNMYMSLLSVDGFDGDIDEEMLSSTDKRPKQVLLGAGLSSDSDKEPGYYSLPATPPRRPRPDQSTAAAGEGGMLHHSKHPNPMVKEYASENEAQTTIMSDDSRRNARSSRKRSRRRIMNNRHSWLSPPSDRGNLAKKKNDNDHDEDEEENKENMNCMMRTGSSQLGHCHSFSGESEGGSCTGTGVVVITRPKGGRRSLCMDLEEVKACRDLGFELEHQHMLQEMPSRLSLSASTHDTNTTCSSGGNSPIANWRISSPGDNPREVKARLKVWAQAVALASTSRQGI